MIYFNEKSLSAEEARFESQIFSMVFSFIVQSSQYFDHLYTICFSTEQNYYNIPFKWFSAHSNKSITVRIGYCSSATTSVSAGSLFILGASASQ